LRFLAQAPQQVRARLAEDTVDAVISMFPVVSGSVVHRAGGAPVHVTVFVGADLHDPTRPWVAADSSLPVRWITRRVVRRASAVTTLSTDMARRLKALFGADLDQRPTVCIPLGVPLLQAPPRREARRRLGVPDDSLLVASACRLVRRKRLDVLLAALARAGLETEHAVRAVIIGDGPLAGELHRQAEGLALGTRVRFTGWLTETEKALWLAAADVVCLPSEHEAQGLALIEAMGLANAVVTTPGGGQSDIVRDGVDGLFVPVGDSAALAARLTELAGSSERLVTMQEAAAARARELTEEQTADGYLALLASLREDAGRYRSRTAQGRGRAVRGPHR
jgi:glycosyltransferase involved in cell wall biosynthesis